uniref:PRAME family member 27-like n=1 Tax=Sus scrofa TaxID=9823 RepID=A0A8D1GIW8_PIG
MEVSRLGDSLSERVRMNVQTPLRLLELAGMNLLRDEASAIAALEFLPTELFPPLFMEAFYGRHRETLTAMVQAWPFVRLPLGGLMNVPHMGTLKAVLDGLNALLAQKVHPRRCKLRVLDLRNTGQYFWSMWSGDKDHVSSSSLMAPVTEDSSRKEHAMAPLEVFIELCLSEAAMDECLLYLLLWVARRKDSIHLCCKKLKIESMPIESTVQFLSMMPLDCLQEVQVNCTWQLATLAKFAPFLGQMSNVQRLLFSPLHVSPSEEQEEQQQQMDQFTSQFLRLHHLRDLYLETPSFLQGRLDQMLRCLKTPLDTLSITHFLLMESDLTYLSQCPNISQLKSLDLSGIKLTNFNPKLLKDLLENVAATIQELGLDECGIMDSQLEAILPALSHCSQLSSFSIRGNPLSMAIIEKLLCHTDGLPSLTEEFYPAPQESYGSQGTLHVGRLAKLKAELIEIMRTLGRPRIIWLSSSPCLHCGDDTFYHMELVTYHCNKRPPRL